MLQQWMENGKGRVRHPVHIKNQDMMVAQHTLCFRNELVKFAYEVFENKLHSSALRCFNTEESHTTYKNVRVWCELRKPEHVRCDILRSF